MKDSLAQLHTAALADLAAVDGEASLESFRVNYLGKKGKLTLLAAAMKDVPKEDKPAVGQLLNEIRQAISSGIETRRQALLDARDAQALAGLDPTLPARCLPLGTRHPISQIQSRVIEICRRLGFSLASGPEVESEFHCFDALNTPADHPARNESDTFYLPDGSLLRTHTSTVQIRTMESQPPPLRIIAPGSAFRRDEIDATHLSAFHQVEGLYVAEDVTLPDLKGTLEFFFRELFGPKTQIRFRPHFFPFTEPSFEIDVQLVTASQSRWIEIAGCGMVDPAVFEAVCQSRGDRAYDPATVSGFAWGMGLDRLAMILFGITDIRHLIENDQRFLRQLA
jgi:phenylalanyl-tRNA synthetase alpha chain